MLIATYREKQEVMKDLRAMDAEEKLIKREEELEKDEEER